MDEQVNSLQAQASLFFSISLPHSPVPYSTNNYPISQLCLKRRIRENIEEEHQSHEYLISNLSLGLQDLGMPGTAGDLCTKSRKLITARINDCCSAHLAMDKIRTPRNLIRALCLWPLARWNLGESSPSWTSWLVANKALSSPIILFLELLASSGSCRTEPFRLHYCLRCIEHLLCASYCDKHFTFMISVFILAMQLMILVFLVFTFHSEVNRNSWENWFKLL